MYIEGYSDIFSNNRQYIRSGTWILDILILLAADMKP